MLFFKISTSSCMIDMCIANSRKFILRLLQVLRMRGREAEPDCHSAESCTESAMTLVTASCPFQRAKAPAVRPRPRVFHPTTHLPLPPRAGRCFGGPGGSCTRLVPLCSLRGAVVSKSHLTLVQSKLHQKQLCHHQRQLCLFLMYFLNRQNLIHKN